ncbi:MAG: methylmalonyl Co-A mutase-associated GTPase MeaB [Actinomycetia bacterium]|nr:methylmalonyl Co-A mutase-associated GTPase MeaB [Actinomycetes bacterium]
MTSQELVFAAAAGDRRALGRLLSVIENQTEALPAITAEISRRSSDAQIVGLTGPPGVGKSTTTSALVRHWRNTGLRVAVLAVDPSSPYSGGALLGDRVRMEDHSADSDVFIRSMAARGKLGGLAESAPVAASALAACGFDRVILETVGVGQSEIDIVSYADTVVVLLAPGMGDSIQAAKAGLLEIADIFAVNKADRPGVRATERELRAMVSMKAVAPGGWTVPVLKLVASAGEGIAELAQQIQSHDETARASGSRAQRRADRQVRALRSAATGLWLTQLDSVDADVQRLATAISANETDLYSAASEVFAAATRPSTRPPQD